jgi:tetratricopeptide repeat protein
VRLLELAAFLAPERIPLTLFADHPELLDEPLRGIAADPDALADAVGALVGYSLARRSPDGFQVHRLVQSVIRHRLPPERQQATAEQVIVLLAAATPGDPDDPANLAAYAQLAPHALATAPLGDHSPAGRRLVLDTIRHLQAHGDSSGSHAARAVAEQLLDRCRSILGPDHPDTLTAASTLIRALVSLGEAAPARALGEDTLQRCHRVLGPDHPTTLRAAATLTGALVRLGEAAPARALGEDTLQRCRRVLGPNHPLTRNLAQVAVTDHPSLGDEATEDDRSPPR